MTFALDCGWQKRPRAAASGMGATRIDFHALLHQHVQSPLLPPALLPLQLFIYPGVGHAFMNDLPAPFPSFEERQKARQKWKGHTAQFAHCSAPPSRLLLPHPAPHTGQQLRPDRSHAPLILCRRGGPLNVM